MALHKVRSFLFFLAMVTAAYVSLWSYRGSPIRAEDVLPWPTSSIVILPDIPLVHTDAGLKRLDTAAFIDEASRLMVPLRFLAEALGANVNYAPPYIHVNLNDVGMSLELDSNIVMMGGVAHIMDTVPVIKNGRTFVPLRILCDSLGLPIQYRDGVALIGPWLAELTPEQVSTWKNSIVNKWSAFESGEVVEITVDSSYYVSGSDLLKADIPLFSYLGEIYAPLQGIMEAKPQVYLWDEVNQQAMITHIPEITPEVREIAERWSYPSMGRGSYSAEYVYPISYDEGTGIFVCQGKKLRTFSLFSEHQNQYHKLSSLELEKLNASVNEATAHGDVLKIICYNPWPLVVGPASDSSPEVIAAWEEYAAAILAPVLIELSLPYSYVDTALVRPITISYPAYIEGEVNALLELSALEFNGALYVSMNELDNHLRWFWFGSCDKPLD